MRRLALLAVLILTIAAPAAAAGGKATVVKPPAEKDAGLRGSQGAGDGAAVPALRGAPASDPSAIPAPLAQSWQAPIPQAGGTDAIQCRTSCAQTYYFCNAGGDEDCAARWAQCAASCTATATAQPYQPAF